MIMEPYGPRATVYQLATSGWYTAIELKYNKNDTRMYELDSLKPYFNLNEFKSFLSRKSFEVLEPVHEKPYIQSNILKDSGQVFSTQAAAKGFPNSYTIGDFQIALKNNFSLSTMTYNVVDIICEGQSCKTECVGPPSSLRIFRDRVSKGLEKPIKFYKGTGTQIITKHPTSASVQLRIGNINANKLHLIPAKCKIHLVYKSACTGCNSKPYLLFQASEIIEEGALEFESNCTFAHNYVSCNTQTYTLEYKVFKSYCYMFIKSTNQSFFIENLERFEGKIEYHHPSYSSDSNLMSENFKGLMKSETFLTSVLSSISFVLTFSFFTLIVRILLKIYEISRINRQTNSI